MLVLDSIFAEPAPATPIAKCIVLGPGNPQALNRYSYVYNNPLKYNDPTGHFAWEPLGGAAF